jgi:hypothetical protein
VGFLEENRGWVGFQEENGGWVDEVSVGERRL